MAHHLLDAVYNVDKALTAAKESTSTLAESEAAAHLCYQVAHNHYTLLQYHLFYATLGPGLSSAAVAQRLSRFLDTLDEETTKHWTRENRKVHKLAATGSLSSITHFDLAGAGEPASLYRREARVILELATEDRWGRLVPRSAYKNNLLTPKAQADALKPVPETVLAIIWAMQDFADRFQIALLGRDFEKARQYCNSLLEMFESEHFGHRNLFFFHVLSHTTAVGPAEVVKQIEEAWQAAVEFDLDYWQSEVDDLCLKLKNYQSSAGDHLRLLPPASRSWYHWGKVIEAMRRAERRKEEENGRRSTLDENKGSAGSSFHQAAESPAEGNFHGCSLFQTAAEDATEGSLLENEAQADMVGEVVFAGRARRSLPKLEEEDESSDSEAEGGASLAGAYANSRS